jgi:hypothetical protein
LFVYILLNDDDLMAVNNELGWVQKQMIMIKFKVLWLTDPLVGKDLKTDNETTAIAMQ